MDEFNNNNNENENNSFKEESFSEPNGRQQFDPYNMPYGQQPDRRNNPYNMPNDRQSNSNNMPDNQQDNPYNMPNERQNNSYSPYNNPYGQQQIPPNYDPYKMPPPQNPYSGVYVDEYGMPYKTGLATASLIIGIISLLLTVSFLIFIPPLGILPIIGIILGCIYKSKHQPVGKGTSTAGIVCSAVSLGLSALFLLLCVYVALNYMPELMDYLKSYSPELYDQYYDMFHDMYPEWFDNAAIFFSKIFMK